MAVEYVESTTPLGVSATFAGTTRDVLKTAPGTPLAADTGLAEVRVSSISDVVGTLALEVSDDAVTWDRVREVVASNTGTGGRFVAEISYKPTARYVRCPYVNGGTAQVRFVERVLLLGCG